MESKRQGFGSPFNLTLRPPANAEHCSQAGVSTFCPSKDKFYSFIEGSTSDNEQGDRVRKPNGKKSRTERVGSEKNRLADGWSGR